MIGLSGIAVKSVTRADAASVAELAKHGVATVHEAMGRVGLLDTYMRPIYPGAKACGTAVTILAHPGDNWMLHVAAEMLERGDVAVLGTSSSNTDGMFGDLLATSFRARGAVDGTLMATGRVDIMNEARVTGRVLAPQLMLADGGILNGKAEPQHLDAALKVARHRRAEIAAGVADAAKATASA